MNVKHPLGVLHSFSIKNIFHDKIDFKAFLFSCGKILINNYSKMKKAAAEDIIFAPWKMKKKRKEKGSHVIPTTVTLLKEFETNYTSFSIVFSSKFGFWILQCNIFFLIRSKLIAKAVCNKEPLSSFFTPI